MSKWSRSQDGLLWLKSAVKTMESNWAKRSQLRSESSWAWPILALSQTGPRSQYGSEQSNKGSVIFYWEGPLEIFKVL